MPHVFVNRRRVHNLRKKREDLRSHFRWETINAFLYKAGGITFIIGSVFFFPRFERFQDIGAWVFFFGSLLYLVVTVHDLAEVLYNFQAGNAPDPGRNLEYIAAVSYTSGTILFTAGSIFFLSWVKLYREGAWCFVIGSLLFVIGSCINVLQIVKARSILTLQLLNLTAVTFVGGLGPVYRSLGSLSLDR